MQVELTTSQSPFIDLGIQEGRFRDSAEAVREALAQWEKRERARVELLASLDFAKQSLEVGEGEEFGLENFASLVESVRQHGVSLLATEASQ